MKKKTKILIICSGIIISIIPAIYFILVLMEKMGVPTKTNADGTTEYLMISTARYNGEPLPSWFMSMWGLIGLFIILIGIKISKTKKRNV